MTEEQRPSQPEPSPPPGTDVPAAEVPGTAAEPDPSRPPRASQGETPLYKGEPLEAERGPGLGCFWTQVIMLGVLLVLTPLTVALAWPPLVSAALLILTLILLLFTGQTVIFLLRLVAADRRGRRTPRSPSARRTVGMIEDGSAEGSDASTAPVSGSPPGADRPTLTTGPDPGRDQHPIAATQDRAISERSRAGCRVPASARPASVTIVPLGAQDRRP